MTAKAINLDDMLGQQDEVLHTRDVVLFGQPWKVVCDVNSYALTAMTTGDSVAITEFLGNIVIDEQRAEFRRALSAQRGLSSERLIDLVRHLVEVVTERPTTPPSGSSRTPKKPTRQLKSAAS